MAFGSSFNSYIILRKLDFLIIILLILFTAFRLYSKDLKIRYDLYLIYIRFACFIILVYY